MVEGLKCGEVEHGSFQRKGGPQAPDPDPAYTPAVRRWVCIVAFLVGFSGEGYVWTVRPRIDFYSQSGFHSREFNVPADRVGSWSQLDASVKIANSGKDWSVTAFVKNLTNQDSITWLEVNSNLVGSFRSAFLLDPRTFGLSLRVGFQ